MMLVSRVPQQQLVLHTHAMMAAAMERMSFMVKELVDGMDEV